MARIASFPASERAPALSDTACAKPSVPNAPINYYFLALEPCRFQRVSCNHARWSQHEARRGLAPHLLRLGGSVIRVGHFGRLFLAASLALFSAASNPRQCFDCGCRQCSQTGLGCFGQSAAGARVRTAVRDGCSCTCISASNSFVLTNDGQQVIPFAVSSFSTHPLLPTPIRSFVEVGARRIAFPDSPPSRLALYCIFQI